MTERKTIRETNIESLDRLDSLLEMTNNFYQSLVDSEK